MNTIQIQKTLMNIFIDITEGRKFNRYYHIEIKIHKKKFIH